MRVQEIFFEQERNGHRLEVIKTYDTASAREAFADMDDGALNWLAKALDLAGSYSPGDIPEKTSSEYADFLWEELLDRAREDGNICSFFVVQEVHAGVSRSLYTSPDWPSAEAFAKQRQVLPK